ncbi:MAG: hypothetical protein ACR2LL_11470 [Nitrosopumilus sp.]
MNNNENNSSNKSVNYSCRLTREIFGILEQESSKKGISLNSLINSILEKYVSLDRHAKDIELISFTKRAVKRIFDNMDDKTIKEMADDVGGVVHRELVFLKFDELTFDNLMHVLIINASRFGSVKHSTKNSTQVICIHHGVNKKFSKFLAMIHETMANSLSIKIFITNVDQNTVCMDIDEPSS